MKLSEVKEVLNGLDKINFQLPDGAPVPTHFHITEVGQLTKNFIDCGGTVHKEEVVNFQLWTANDLDHRLKPDKLLNIIALSEKVLNIGDFEIEVEYQAQTIGKFGLEFDGTNFLLTSKQTDCLDKDKCGIPSEKASVNYTVLQTNETCTPNSGCC